MLELIVMLKAGVDLVTTVSKLIEAEARGEKPTAEEVKSAKAETQRLLEAMRERLSSGSDPT